MIVFISYSSKDRTKIGSLAGDIVRLGHTVWFDQELSHTGGQKWWTNILQQVRECDLFIFALSPNSLASPACQREYRYAYALGKRILPVLIAEFPVGALPYELQELQIVQYGQRSLEEGLALAGSLANLPVARPLPDPLPPEPEVPINTQANLASRLEAASLSKAEQTELYFELEALFESADTNAVARTLLRELYSRPDLVMHVGDKIRVLMPELGEKTQPGPNRRRRYGVAILVVVLLAVAGIWILIQAVPAFILSGTKAAADVTSTNALQPITQPSGQPTVPVSPISPTVSPSLKEISPPTLTLTSVPPTNTSLPPTRDIFAQVTSNNQWQPTFQTFNGIEMALVPPGCFIMGSATEQPTSQQCFTTPFWIDKTEVSQAQFQQLGGQAALAPYYPGSNLPIMTVSWSEANAFCKNRGGRLPTEAEWEYAARGPDDLIYPWGNTFDGAKAVFHRSNGPEPVGTHPEGASWTGAQDMAGNVWERVNSIYSNYPYRADDGRENPSNTTSVRETRGGAWISPDANYLRTSARGGGDPPDEADRNTGFRCMIPYH